MALRAEPFPSEEESRSMIQIGLEKEVGAAIEARYPSINWDPLFGSHHSTLDATSFIKNGPIRPNLYLYLRYQLSRWKDRMVDRLLVPQMSAKTMGVESSANLLSHFPPSLNYKTQRLLSTIDAETFYADNGFLPSGPCEMRYAWKFNDLKPRVYYAQGLSAYKASRYVHDIFDSLQRFIPSTNPATRYSVARLQELSSDDALYIYDYTSFTSRLVDNRNFIDRLADFCDDTSIFLFDTHEGPIKANLGAVIRAYNLEVNYECPFDVTKILALSEPLILHMASSGPLGVPGNIVSSTITHGIIQAEITGSVDRGNAIGDDAVGLFGMNSDIQKWEVMDLHRSIGSIEESKACWWTKNSTGEGSGWHYVKRPLDRVDNMISVGWMPDYPNYPVLLGVKDTAHTVPPADFETRRIMCVKQVGRFFNYVLSSGYALSDMETSFILTTFRYLYGRLNLNPHGAWPNVSKSKDSKTRRLRLHFTPPLLEECFERSWISILLDMKGPDQIILLPREDSYDEWALPEDPSPGVSFEYAGNRVLGALENIGILEKRKIYDEVLVTEADRERVARLVNGGIRALYLYTFLIVPDYWCELADLVARSPTLAEVTVDDDMEM